LDSNIVSQHFPRLLRLFSSAGRSFVLLGISALNVGLAASFVAFPLVLRARRWLISLDSASFSAGSTLACMNAGDAILASAFFGLALLALAHRLLWPMVCRPVYAVSKLGKGRKKLMLIVGAPLVGFATGGVPDSVTKALEGFL
jgi:hypothetical protein